MSTLLVIQLLQKKEEEISTWQKNDGTRTIWSVYKYETWPSFILIHQPLRLFHHVP